MLCYSTPRPGGVYKSFYLSIISSQLLIYAALTHPSCSVAIVSARAAPELMLLGTIITLRKLEVNVNQTTTKNMEYMHYVKDEV